MINFKWEYVTYESGSKYIYWSATWDGEHENDPLYTPCGIDFHPFDKTGYYEQEERFYKNLLEMSPEEKAKDMVFTVINDDGTETEESFGNFSDTDPEEHNPKNIREVGDTVAVNPVTIALCEMLSDPESIKEASGHTCPYHYRSKLIGILDSLWD